MSPDWLSNEPNSMSNMLLPVWLQIGVLQWFAKLWEIDTEDYWGYITNCGTEGNLHGILVGRENHPEGEQAVACEHDHFTCLSCMQCACVGIIFISCPE